MDMSKLDPREIVYQFLGGSASPFRIEIDEILVHSAWRPYFCIAEKYMSDGGRIFLAGDAGKHPAYSLHENVAHFSALPQLIVQPPMVATA